MKEHTYKAVTTTNNVVPPVKATSRLEAAEKLRDMGYTHIQKIEQVD